MIATEFINKIKYLALPLRQHGTKVIEYKSKVNGLLFIALFFIFGCGSGNGATDIDASIATQSPPVVVRVNPTSGRAGNTITIFGLGFSAQPGNNLVSIGTTSTTALTYALVNPPTAGEIESLTFTIPSGAATGANSVFVTVFENTSNTNVQFTVNP